MLNGRPAVVAAPAADCSLLDALREVLGVRSVKDGCSPQGQCGCCTVLVDGAPRVACVTPLRRVADRKITTLEGLAPDLLERWARAFADHGASQCGFCSPGIVLRLAALADRPRPPTERDVRSALLAHLCRCTGWQGVVDAARAVLGIAPGSGEAAPPAAGRDPLRSAWRAELEGGTPQLTGVGAVLGRGGFADDRAPPGALVAVRSASGDYLVAPDRGAARRAVGKVQGRNSTVGVRHPVAVPEGDWALTLRTTWVEPAYLEPDASWSIDGRRAASPLAAGGAFGGKRSSPVAPEARRLAASLGRPVRVLWSREDVGRWGPKRPPVAMAVAADGHGVVRVGASPGGADLGALAERLAAVEPRFRLEQVPVVGPPVSAELRGVGWVEPAVLGAAWRVWRQGTVGAGVPVDVRAPGGGRARVAVRGDGGVEVEVWAGEVLDEVVLRSYCTGAVHQALGWVWSEGVAVDDDGEVLDLTIRSLGILNALEMPEVELTVHRSDGWPRNGSDAVFAATAAAAWAAEGLPPTWPTRR